ncbi:hypothetical protein JCM9279_006410 [Rhodotorula babjevae]
MFRKAIGRFLDVFYDDVFVYSRTRRAHLRYLKIVFSTLRHFRFYLSRSKVEFLSPSLEALGVLVDNEGLHVMPDKWEAIQRWPTPRCPKDILRFMGAVGWMAEHLPRVNEIAAPLTRLTGKVNWNWTAACDLSFKMLKQLVPQALRPLDPATIDSGAERLFLGTDASIYGCGGWLGQGASLKSARPVRFFSSKFNPAQRNYSTTNQELLGVLVGCKKNHEYIVGFPFTVVCDHKPLKTYWTQPPKQTRRHVRLWETLAEYNFSWQFIPGKTNELADALSRLAELDGVAVAKAVEPAPAQDNPEPFLRTVLSAGKMVLAGMTMALASVVAPSRAASSISSSSRSSLSLMAVSLTTFPLEFLSSLRACSLADPLTKTILAAPDQHPNFLVRDSLVYLLDPAGERLVVPSGRLDPSSFDNPPTSPPTFVEWVIESVHQSSGHLGAKKTLAGVRRAFFWPTLGRDVHNYVRQCESCARNKSSTQRPLGLLHPLSVPGTPWAQVGMDFVVGLPPVKLNGATVDSILTVTDYLSKMVILIPLASTATAEDVAAAFFRRVVSRFGLPSAIVSDRDPKFTSNFWSSLYKLLGVKLKMLSAAHPQMDGRAEVTNKVVGAILRSLCEDDPLAWPTHLALGKFALNSAPSASTLLLPFEVVHGFVPSLLPALASAAAAPGLDGDAAATAFAERAREYALRATDAIIGSRVAMVALANRRRRLDEGLFAVGGKAYISSSSLRFPKGVARKFLHKFVGPFPILEVDAAHSTCTFDLPSHMKVHDKIHSSRLRPWYPNDNSRFPSRAFSDPPPVIGATDDPDAEYEVDKIVAEKTLHGRVKYKVRWLGWSAQWDSWLDRDELLKSAKETVLAYEAAKAARRAAPIST